MSRRILTRPVTWIVVAVVAAGALYWFQPWRLFTNTTVADQLTAVVSEPPAPASSAAVPVPDPAKPKVVARGTFVTHEHDTSGTARLVRAADGSHRLELAGLSTSDGPDLRVWLTDQPVRTGADGWQVFDDGEHVELGRLKGNRGDQVYPIKADVDPARFRSVTIWCDRFSVSFGAAELARA